MEKTKCATCAKRTCAKTTAKQGSIVLWCGAYKESK